jgi:hypothetical protein
MIYTLFFGLGRRRSDISVDSDVCSMRQFCEATSFNFLFGALPRCA